MSEEAEKKSPKKKDKSAELEQKLMKQVTTMIIMAEEKMEAKIRSALIPVSEEMAKIDRALSEINDEIHRLKDVSRLQSVEQSVNQMRREFGAFQNKMFGADLAKPLCDEHELKLKLLDESLCSLKEKLAPLAPMEMEIKELAKKHKDLEPKLPLAEEKMEMKLKALKEQLEKVGDQAVGRSDYMKEMVSEFMSSVNSRFEPLMKSEEMIEEKLKSLLSGLENLRQLAKNDMMDLKSSVKESEQEVRKMVDQGIGGFDAKIKDCLDRIDFAEMQGNRMNRLEKAANQHDQMIKEMYRQIKGE